MNENYDDYFKIIYQSEPIGKEKDNFKISNIRFRKIWWKEKIYIIYPLKDNLEYIMENKKQ